MALPPRPVTTDRSVWASWLTRGLISLYLRAPGQSAWIETERQLVDGIRATGWLDDHERPHLPLEVCGGLIPRWRAGELYHLNASFLRAEREAIRQVERPGPERHGQATVHNWTPGVEPQYAAPDEYAASGHGDRVRAAVEEVRAGLPGARQKPEIVHRRVLLFAMHVVAAVNTTDNELADALNDALRQGGHAPVNRSTVSKDMTALRHLLFRAIRARLDAHEERVLFVHSLGSGEAIESARRVALDALVRTEMGAVAEGAPAPELVPDLSPPPEEHLLRRWWRDWPIDPPTRARWDAVFTDLNPHWNLPGGPVGSPVRSDPLAPPAVDRVLAEMSEHLDGWHLYRRAAEPWRRRLDGDARTFPPGDPVWEVVDKAAGPLTATADRPARVRLLDDLLVSPPKPRFADLPRHLGLSLGDVLVLLRAFRERSRRVTR